MLRERGEEKVSERMDGISEGEGTAEEKAGKEHEIQRNEGWGKGGRNEEGEGESWGMEREVRVRGKGVQRRVDCVRRQVRVRTKGAWRWREGGLCHKTANTSRILATETEGEGQEVGQGERRGSVKRKANAATRSLAEQTEGERKCLTKR